MRKYILTAIPAAALVLTMTAQAWAAGVNLNFGSGRQGGSQYPVTVAIGQVLEKLPQFNKFSLQPGGSIGNVIKVDTGKSDIAITMSMSVWDGRKGNSPFKKKVVNVVQLMTLHAFNVVAFVPVDSKIKSYKDFVGKKINFAPVGYSINELGMRLLKKLGISGKVKVGHLRINAAVQQLKDGHIDGFLYSPSDRYGPIINLAETREIRAIQLDMSIMKAVIKENPSFYLTSFPKKKGIYKKLVNSVQNLAYPNVIIANKKRISSAQAYAMVKAVAENFSKVAVGDPSLRDFDPKGMSRQVGTPFHRGAVKYYRERGWVK